MNPQALAQEIIDGRRLTRQDDLKAFLTCDLQALCEGADKIRKHFVGERVDLCSIINGRSGRCPGEILRKWIRHLYHYQWQKWKVL